MLPTSDGRSQTPAADPVEMLAALERPAVAGEIDPPEVLVAGRAQVRPEPGARVFLLAAAGRTCGLLLDGPATLSYAVDDPFSLPLARRNASRAHGAALRVSGSEATLTAPLRGAAIWGWNLDAGSSRPRPADRTLPPSLQDVLEKKEDRAQSRATYWSQGPTARRAIAGPSCTRRTTTSSWMWTRVQRCDRKRLGGSGSSQAEPRIADSSSSSRWWPSPSGVAGGTRSAPTSRQRRPISR